MYIVKCGYYELVHVPITVLTRYMTYLLFQTLIQAINK